MPAGVLQQGDGPGDDEEDLDVGVGQDGPAGLLPSACCLSGTNRAGIVYRLKSPIACADHSTAYWQSWAFWHGFAVLQCEKSPSGYSHFVTNLYPCPRPIKLTYYHKSFNRIFI